MMSLTRTLLWLAVLSLCGASSGAKLVAQGGEVWLYADLWPEDYQGEQPGEPSGDEFPPNGGVAMFGAASGELPDCCPGCPDLQVEDDIIDPSASSAAYSSNTAFCYASTYTSFDFIDDSVTPDGEWFSRGRARENCAESQQISITRWQALYHFAVWDGSIGMYSWAKEPFCSGGCQMVRRCTHTHPKPYLVVRGARIWFSGNPESICKPTWQEFFDFQQPCVQQAGIPVGDNCPHANGS